MLHVLATDLLNSLTAGIAVLDANGIIVVVNDEWKRFARENGGDDKEFNVGDTSDQAVTFLVRLGL